MKILNLYAGLGGNRKLWEGHRITAVENNPEIAAYYKERFPEDTVIVGDAKQYLLDNYKDFDFVWSSPPCQTHSRMQTGTRHKLRYPDLSLYQQIIFLRTHFKGKFVVENVRPYYTPLIPGTPFGRHLFWTNFRLGFFQVPEFKDSLALQTSIKGAKKIAEFIGLPYKTIYAGTNNPGTVWANCVNPELGLYMLNTAQGIITKQNLKQTDLFHASNTGI